MRSELLACLLLLFACGGGLHGDSLEAPPLATVRVSIDPTDPRWQGIDGQLHVGLAWLQAREYSAVCDKVRGHPELSKACPDPFAVELYDLATTAPLDLDEGEVTLDLARLPDARVSVGALDGRVAYGAAIVFREFDGNGWLDRLFAPRGRRGRRAIQENVDTREILLGTSFHSLLERHQRVAFVEGKWQPLSLFYPLVGCDTPPQGLSIIEALLSLTFVDGEPQLDGDCQVSPLTTPVRVEPITREEAFSLECPSPPRRLRDPVNDELPADGKGVCLDAGTYAHLEKNEGSPCSRLRVWSLSGCRDGDSRCDEPDWDHRDNPPAGWSCE